MTVTAGCIKANKAIAAITPYEACKDYARKDYAPFAPLYAIMPSLVHYFAAGAEVPFWVYGWVRSCARGKYLSLSSLIQPAIQPSI
jgi:hypothetical protein